MAIPAPHFVLFSETSVQDDEPQWRFMLTSSDGQQKLIAADHEPHTYGERLELLSVVRGLEALDQPSQVTLVTDSRFVAQGMTHGLSEWRENDWCWERFGELTPVKHRDLWQRVDRALAFHQVDCRTWRFDPPQKPAGPNRPVEWPVRPSESAGGPVPSCAFSHAMTAADATVQSASLDTAKTVNAKTTISESATSETTPALPAGPSRWGAARSWLAERAESVKKIKSRKMQIAGEMA